MTVADCVGMTAEEIQTIIDANHVPAEVRRAKIDQMVQDYYNDMRKNRY